ncbi:helix-turn-helix domain-containing protein [Ligilactobacillus salivarius]|uniref:helix-turn-helix domain-containing protein n=1 Tax=Ligilactobacillus salivarius TaxID=1624 RepID=UPI0026730C3E|nr:helix-turn-helix transcriptional regulator [Ligilactobacillus salivarius]
MFGSRLRDLRNEKKLTQDDLGKMLNVSGKTIGAWERDSRQPNIEAINKIASIFNVSTDYLLGRPEKKEDDAKTADIEDLDKMIDNARSFGGKKMTENDREIIKAYLKGFYDNKNQGK